MRDSLLARSLFLSPFLFFQCIPFRSARIMDAPRRSDNTHMHARMHARTHTHTHTQRDSLSLSLSLPPLLSLFCDLISARIKHRRTDVHLTIAEKAVCESCSGRSWQEGRPAELCARLFSLISLRFPYGKSDFTFSSSTVKFARWVLVPYRA